MEHRLNNVCMHVCVYMHAAYARYVCIYVRVCVCVCVCVSEGVGW